MSKSVCRNCTKYWRGAAETVRHESDQHCAERHEHCSVCGRILCMGDWDAPPIATYAVALGRRGGLANTPAQQAARKKPKPGAGRPRKHPAGPASGPAEEMVMIQ